MVDTYKVQDVLFRCMQHHYWPCFNNQDSATLLECENAFKEYLGLDLSVVRRPDDGWNCFVIKKSKPYGISSHKIVFKDAWSSDFTYEECLENLMLYYFVELGYIRLPRCSDNDNSITLYRSDFVF